MRIGVSLLNFRPGCMGGIETYFRKLAEFLPACAEEAGDRIVFFANREVFPLLPDGGAAEGALLDRSRFGTSVLRLAEVFTPFRSRSCEALVARAGVDVLFVPHQATFPKSPGVPVVITAHDVQHLRHPEYFSSFDRAFRKRAWDGRLAAVSGIVAISRFTAGCLREVCGVAPERIRVVHHGFDPPKEEPLAPLEGLDDPYLFYPAASYPHKGHVRLLESYAALRKAGRLDCRLVFCGMKTPHWKKAERAMRRLGIEEDVSHLGFVDRTTVRRLYAHCRAVVFPTEYEGFGLPVAEAAGFGKRIVCSKLEVFDELGVPKERQIDFSDPEALFDALEKEGPETPAPAYSWKDCARDTLRAVKSFS